MNIDEQFNLIAKEYDCNRKLFIPCFSDYYETTTDFLATSINTPKRVLDLGAGTGLLSSFWYEYFPDSQYVLVDVADEMLNIARKRFCGLENISYEVLNYINDFPNLDFDLIISALSIHHLEQEEKEKLFKRIYKKLPDGGMFINYDQFCGGSQKINYLYDSYWKNQLESSGLSKKDLELWKELRKLDRECSLEDEIEMLKKSGFKEVKCVYSSIKFSVILSIK